jgi:hypothetical protein
MEENSSDELKEIQMTSQDGTNPSSQDFQSQPAVSEFRGNFFPSIRMFSAENN